MLRLPLLLPCLALIACGDTQTSPRSEPDAAPEAAQPTEDGSEPPPPDQETPPEPDASEVPDQDAAAPSSGCGQPPGPNDQVWSVTHDSRERTFRVHLPPGYDAEVPTAVVLNFHGRGSNAQQQIAVSKLLAVSDAGGFIAVHPEGVGGTWNAGLCCGEAMDTKVDDVGFTRAMLDSLEARLCVDSRRLFATGLSNGGYMVQRLACEAADRIAAIGSVAGTNGFPACAPSRAVPVYHFHGTADTVVPYDGFGGYTSVDATMKFWVSNNGCSGSSQTFFDKDEVSCEEWIGCHDEATVRLCTIDGGGHQWPGGFTIPMLGNNTDVISASEEVWSFFAAHPLP